MVHLTNQKPRYMEYDFWVILSTRIKYFGDILSVFSTILPDENIKFALSYTCRCITLSCHQSWSTSRCLAWNKWHLVRPHGTGHLCTYTTTAVSFEVICNQANKCKIICYTWKILYVWVDFSSDILMLLRKQLPNIQHMVTLIINY